MDWTIIFDKLILVVIIFVISLAIAAYSTYGERKIAALFQDRIDQTAQDPLASSSPWLMVLSFF